MTLAQYAERVALALREAHNDKDVAALESVFREADHKLSTLTDRQRQTFWVDVKKKLRGPWRVENQANSSLLQLMKAIQQGLAERGAN
jgi:hypothetical protein